MAVGNFLPRRYSELFKRMSVPHTGLRTVTLAHDPRYHTLYTHWMGDVVPDEWPAAKTNGTSAAVSVAGTAGSTTSVLRMVSGTDDNGYAGQGYYQHWKAGNGLYMACALIMPAAVTDLKIEVGLTDSSADAGAINAKATPTATADDAVVLILDTDDNAEFDLLQIAATTPAAAVENVKTLVGGTTYTFEFVGSGSMIAAYIDGAHVGTGTLTSTVALTPWVFCQARAVSTSKTLDCDWLYMTGPIA
jgi:hypothetical protein